MPNPYHDETGKFCSKEEMGAAVDRLATAVAVASDDGEAGFKERYQQSLDAYFELRRDYDAINRGVAEMPEDWVAAVSSSGLQNSLPNSEQGIEAIYRSGLSDELRKPSGFRTPKALGLFTNEHTPQWIKDDIYRNASPEIKAEMIEEMSRELFGNKYIKITSEHLLPFTWGDNGHYDKVTRALLASSKLDFNAKYELAKERGNLGYFLDNHVLGRGSTRYSEIPEMEKDLKLEWKNPLRPEKNRLYAAHMLARNTKDSNLRGELLKFDGGILNGESMLSSLAQNPNLNEGQSIDLLHQSLQTDAWDFELVYSNLSENPLAPEFLREDCRTRVAKLGFDTKGYRGASEASFSSARSAVVLHYNAELDAGIERFPKMNRESPEFAEKVLGANKAADYWQKLAVLDAEPGRYETLRTEAKKLAKKLAKAAPPAGKVSRGDSDELRQEAEALRAVRAADNRLRNARNLRRNSLVLDQVRAEYAATI